MPSDRIELLSPREQEVLTLAGQGLRSKEIARLLGISYRTVDVHIANAVEALGARTRLDAALMLSEGYAKLRKQPPAIADISEPIAPMPPDRRGLRPWLNRLPILRNGRQTNDMTSQQRLGWIFFGAVAIIILLAQLANGLSVAQQIALRLTH